MGSALLDGLLTLLSPIPLLLMTLGMVIGLVLGFLPGLGGLATLALLLPFVIGMEPTHGLAFIIGAYGAVYFGGSVTAILANTPGTGEQVVTTFDGYQMSRQGKSGHALGVSAASCALGGVFGGIVLFAAIPVARQLIIAIRPPEIFALALVGIMVMGIANARTALKGVASGALGLMVSFVGLDPVTGVSRMTFGELALEGGLGVTAVTMGLFALAEMFIVFTKGVPIAGTAPVHASRQRGHRVIDGFFDTVRNWRMVLQCGTLGAVTGMVPGLGGTVAMFGAYGYAKKRSKNPETFGKGNLLGVLGPEAAGTAKEGGSFVPTLTFGIPGSSGMAIMIGILLLLGYTPGPELVQNNLNIIFLIVWIVAFSNILASALGLAIAPGLAKIAFVRPQIIAPALIGIALIGSFVEMNLGLGMLLAVIFGGVGYVFKAGGYSSASFILGFVLGPIIDRNLQLALQAYGATFFLRPITAGLLTLVFAALLWPLVKQAVRWFRDGDGRFHRRAYSGTVRAARSMSGMSSGERTFELVVAGALLAFGLWYLVSMLSYPAGAGLVPAIIASVMLGAVAVHLALLLVTVVRPRPQAVDGIEGTVASRAAEGQQSDLQPDDSDESEGEESGQSYATMIALDRAERGRLVTICLWTILFLLGALTVGFVVTAGFLTLTLFLYTRQGVFRSLLASVAGAAVAYMFTVVLLDLPLLQGIPLS